MKKALIPALIGLCLPATSRPASATPAPPQAAAVAPPPGSETPIGDPDLTQKVDGLASDAVDKKLLPQKTRAAFQQYALPALRNGCVLIVKVSKEDIPGSEAVYDSSLDLIKARDFDASDVKAAAVILHELVHVSQDAAQLGQYRKDSELDAYTAEAEYEMRTKGILRERDDGAVEIQAGNVSTLDQLWQMIIYQYAVENVAAHRAGLNAFSDGSGTHFEGQESADVLTYFTDAAKTARVSAQGIWASSTDISAAMGGSVHDTNEFLQKDGLHRCPK
jgi:hypothetical protein